MKVNDLIIIMMFLIAFVFTAAACVPLESVAAPEPAAASAAPAVTSAAPSEEPPSEPPAPSKTAAPDDKMTQPQPADETKPASPPEPQTEAGPETQEGETVHGNLETKPSEIEYESGLFSWEAEAYLKDNGARLYMMLKALDIDEIYQSFEGKELKTKEAACFMRDAKTMNVDVYYLAGSRKWGLDESGKGMIDVIKLVKAYNAEHTDTPFTGIMFDVESFLNEAWYEDAEAVMNSFASGARAAYDAAADSGLRIVHCIPIWYDTEGYEEQLKILQDSCDELSVMNYDRRDEAENMRTETELAREAGKPITCIYEFQSIKYHGLTDNETYYNFGIEAALESFDEVYRELDYEKMKFAYHYFKPLDEIID